MSLPEGLTIVGRFQILAPIGAGSMGEVYQAHDVKLRRDVALKLLSPALATSQEHLLRFEREARAASALNHPHICTIYDVGTAPEADGRPYLVMELLKGETLYEVLSAGPLTVHAVITLGVQIADALDAAHGAGIIHRDLKPANIFVTSRGDAKLLDFGLAAVTPGAGPAADAPSDAERPEVLTNPGTAVGTVLYMSPEQALGDPLDRRTDLFSFGLVLYEMLTGRRAFEGRSTTAIIDALLHATPAGLSANDVSTVPKELRRLLTRLLAKNPSDRPKTAAEVAAHLRAVQSGSIAGREYAAAITDSRTSSDSLAIGSDVYRGTPGFSPAGPLSSSGLTRALQAGTVRDAAAIVTALLLVVLFGYGGYRWYQGRVPALHSQETLLLADFTNTTGEAVFDGALRDALEIQLQQSPFLHVVPASQVRSALQLMERLPTERITPAISPDLCERLGAKAVMLGSIAPLASAYVITLEAQACRTGDTIAREQTQAASKTDVLSSVGGAAARLRERLGESIGSIQRYNVPAPNATTPSLEALKAYSSGIETRVKTGDLQAIPLFEHALELDPNFALAAARLGAIYTNLRDVERAQEYMKRAFARSESLSEPERLFIKSHYHYIVTGRLDEVVGTYRLWTETYPQDWIPHNNLSDAYFRLNQFESALQEARKAVTLSPDSSVPYQEAAQTLLVLDRFSEVKDVLRDAAAKGLDSSVARAFAFDLAFLDRDAGAMQEHLRAASSRADSYLVLTEAARAALASGELDSSRTLYAQAVTAARAARIDDYAGSLLAEQALGDALLGHTDRAQQELDAAVAVSTGAETSWVASLAAAFAGRVAQGAQLAAAYQRAAPPAPDIVGALAPALQAAVALASGDGRRALAALTAAMPYERSAGPWVTYLRGLAYASLHDASHAVAQFRDVLAHRGNQPTNLAHTLARLQLARALRDQGDVAGARDAYADFAAVWKDADRREPLVEAATREAAALPDPAKATPP